MPKFAANVSTMFTELDEPERFRAARDAGFLAVEYLRPYAYKIAEVKQWLDDAGLEMILLNTLLGDVEKGERGLAALPGREAEFREIFDLALDYASGLGAGMMHLMAGVVPDGTHIEQCEAVFVENLRSVADLAKAKGVRILLEPLNAQDVPGYLHSRSADTRRIIEAVGSDNVFLQFDFYHLQIMEGNLAQGMRSNLDVIGHIQFSSVPGRHEPQHGEVNMPFLFDVVDELGYDGWIGCEYQPKTTTLEGLSWAEPYGIAPS
ncbi:MAG: hydroxypyruvate isomerase family protein [Gammaproteobacteria bacterium]|nr:hydroxypyruvate isomerase family protein [Gammaproteobacteria bacterium]